MGMKTLHRGATRRLEIWLTADVERALVHLAQERGHQPASLLIEVFEEWLQRQEPRIETLDERPRRAPRRARQEPVPLATIRF